MNASTLKKASVKLKHSLGVDRAIAFSILGRGWSSMAGLLTLFLITHYLSRAEQGYYYTFFSLVALQTIFELGFSVVILQMASHERAQLEISDHGVLGGDERSHARLASVLKKSVLWYSIAAGVMFLILVPLGFYFFAHHAQAGPPVAWKLAWFLVVLASSCAFQIDPLFSFLEGCGFIPQVASARLWQALLSSVAAWLALISHHGLYAPAAIIFTQMFSGSAWLFTRRKLLLSLLRHSVGEHRIKWFTEVWPFQWRIAVSWISGYFIFQLFNPVLFAFRGPVEAGQMGMSLSIAGVVLSIGAVWINTKAAIFGTMIARKQYRELDSLFFRATAQSWAICLGVSLLALSVDIYLRVKGLPLGRRLLDPLTLGLLLLTVLANHLVQSEAVYLRAHKQEKFLSLSVCVAVLMALSTYFLGRFYGARGMVTGYFLLTAFVSLGFGTAIFFKYRRIWHAE